MINMYFYYSKMRQCCVFLLFALATLMGASASAQVYQSYTAKASQSDNRAAPYDASNFNDKVIATPGGTTPWSWLSATNTSGTSAWVMYEWPKAVSMNQVIFYNTYDDRRSMTGVEIQSWDGSNWKTVYKYSGSLAFEIDVTFPTVTTSKLRFTNFTISGTQASNPAWREIEVIYNSYGPNDIGIASVDSPTTFCAGNHDIKLSVSNYGINQVDTFTIDWELDGVAQKSIKSYSLLDTVNGKGSSTLSFNLGSYSFSKERIIKAWTSNPNNIKDTVNTNDTIEVVLKPSLSGLITVGPKGDYTDVKSVADDLSKYGVCGPVTVKVNPGTYSGNIVLGEIQGASAINTIDFVSAHVDSVTITNSGTSTSDLVTILLEGADYVSFTNFTIRTTGSTYGIGVMFTDEANYNKLIKNKFDINTSTTSAYTSAIIFSGSKTSYSTYGNNGNYNIINCNEIIRGFYVIRLAGSSSSSFIVGNKIRWNTFTEQYYYGIYGYYNDSIEIVGNRLTGFRNTYNYGIYMNYLSNFNIERNWSECYYYLRLYYANYYLWNKTSMSNFSNNVQISTGTSYGLYLYRSSNINMYHNTISSTGTNYSMYINYSDDIDIKNNIFYYDGSNSLFYIYNSTFEDFDYNDIYSAGSGTIANYGGTVSSSLASFQSTSLTNENSWSLDPEFVSSTDVHVTNKFPDMYGAPVGIDIDYDGDTRCTFAPTVGADELTKVTLPPTAGMLVPDTAWLNSNTSIFNTNKPGGAQKATWYVNGKVVSDSLHLVYKAMQVGVDTISLVMENCSGKDSIAKTIIVSPTLRKPIADFTANSKVIYTNEIISLKDISENGSTSWKWKISPVIKYDPFLQFFNRTFDYLGAKDSTTANPDLVFNYPGKYEVCLIVENSLGADSLCKTDYIVVKEKFIACQTQNESNALSGTFYDDGGEFGFYSNNLNGFNQCVNKIFSCEGEVELNIKMFDLNSGDYLRLYDGRDNNAEPLWDAVNYPDGMNGNINDPSVTTNIIATSGSVFIEFETDNNTATLGAGFEIDWEVNRKNFIRPVADFTMTDTACVGYPVYFEDNSTGVYSDIEWDIENDGKIEGYDNIQSYTFNTPGTYDVKLLVNSFCTDPDSIIKSIVIVNAARSPKPGVYVDKTVVSLGDTVTLNDISEYCSSSTTWEITPSNYVLVNGTSLNDKDVSIVFTKNGYYDIKQVKGNSFGKDSVTLQNYIQVLNYCEPYVFQLDGDIGISRVKFNTIDRTSKIGLYGYSNFMNSSTTTVEKGVTYGLTIERSSNTNPMSRKAWIDFNRDGNFDASELVLSESAAKTLVYTDSITIPFNAVDGLTRMRVATSYNNQINDACGPMQRGEYEDYGVIISSDDNTIPVISLLGSKTDTIEVFDSYLDPGFAAYDKNDGPINNQVTISSTLDTTLIGKYTITYNVMDAAGNAAITKTRTIYVVDRTMPTVTLNGVDSVFVEIFNSFNDPEVTVSDNYYNSLNWESTSNVDTSKLGTYIVEYCVTDGSGNGPICVTRKVVVGDTTKPIIALKGDAKVTIDVHRNYIDSGYALMDNNLESVIVTKSGTWSGVPDSLGTYTLTYTATDASGNVATVSREITVEDREAPRLQLLGNKSDTVIRWSNYSDALYTLSDNYYGSVELKVITGGSFVNTQSLGDYYITYVVEDPSGNVSEEYTRRITVVEDPTSINEIQVVTLNVYPNPTSQLFKLDIELKKAELMQISIINTLGQNVQSIYSGNAQAYSNTIDVSNLNDGVYFVKINTNSGIEITKLTIQK